MSNKVGLMKKIAERRTNLMPITSLAAGNSFSLALDDAGTVWTWGKDILDGAPSGKDLIPRQIPGLENIVEISAGADHGLALSGEGGIWAWGANTVGQLGNDDGPGLVRVRRPPDFPRITSIAAGGAFSTALSDDGRVWFWGWRWLNQNPLSYEQYPVLVSGLTHIISISVGASHALALREDQTVWAWGYNAQGQLGNGSVSLSTRNVPECVVPPIQVRGLIGASSIGAGQSHSVATVDGDVWAWGANEFGQLGDGTFRRKSIPVPVVELADIDRLVTGPMASYTYAIQSDGTGWAWGANETGQFGLGVSTRKPHTRTTPSRVPQLAELQAIALGGGHTLGAKEDGSVWAWGANSYGQLGDGTMTDRFVPIKVGAFSSS
jgi:alpha-tubulin suppressor-like RCC1 family protein